MFKRVLISFLFFSALCLQIQAQVLTSTGSGGNYLIVNYPGNFTAYYTGFTLTFKANHSTLGAATININSLGAVPILNTSLGALAANDIKANQFANITYDGTQFQMTTTSGNVTAGGGGISGSGTINFLPKWSGTTSLSNSLIFDDGTNVGIGTATPSYRLHLYGTSLPGIGVDVSGTSSSVAVFDFVTKGNGINPVNDGATKGWNFMAYSDAFSTSALQNDLRLRFYNGTGQTDVMHFDASTGNVGIGIVSPGAKLEVSGQIKITGGSPANGAVLTSDAVGLASWQAASGGLSGGVTNYLPKWTSTTTLSSSSLIFDNGTNIGIGTNSPISKLNVVGGRTHLQPSNTSVNNGLQMNVDSMVSGSTGIYVAAPSAWTGNIIKSTLGGSDQFAIHQNGSAWFNGAVGIGTNTPTSTLQVNGSLGMAYREFNSNSSVTDLDMILIYTGGGPGTLNISFTPFAGRVLIIRNQSFSNLTFSPSYWEKTGGSTNTTISARTTLNVFYSSTNGWIEY